MDLIPRESRGLEDLLGPWILNYSMHHTTCKTGKSSDRWALHRNFNAIGLGWGECAFLTSAQVMLMGPPLENPRPSSCCSFQYWSKLFCSRPMKCCHYLNEMLPLLKGSRGIPPSHGPFLKCQELVHWAFYKTKGHPGRFSFLGALSLHWEDRE